MGYDSASSQLIEFGGFNGSTDLNDTWDWDGNTWTELSPAQNPPARQDASMAFDPAMGPSGELLLFGGISGSTYLDDTWAWNGATWTGSRRSVRALGRTRHWPTTRAPPKWSCSEARIRVARLGTRGLGMEAPGVK